MRYELRFLAAVISVVMLLAGCGLDNGGGAVDGGIDGPPETEAPPDGDPETPGEPDGGEDGDESPPVVREPVIEGEIVVEGEAQPISFILVESPEDWPLPFTTYHTDDFEAVVLPIDEGAGLVFYANFDGNRNEDAFLTAFGFAAGTDKSEAEDFVAGVVERLGINEDLDGPAAPKWASGFWRGQTWDGEFNASLSFGEKDGSYFFISTHYPLEMGDGFGPRAQVILDEWQWTETGEALVDAQAK